MSKFKSYLLFLFLLVFIMSGCTAQREEAEIVSADVSSDAEITEGSTLSGRAEAGEIVKVISKQSGKASEVYVGIGSEVEKGQALLQLDARDLSAGVDAARAKLENDRIAYQSAQDNEKRAKMLKDNGALGIADYENNYLNVLERAKSAVDLAQASLDKAKIAYEDSTVTAPISGTVAEVNVDPGELVNSQIPSIVIINLDEMLVKLYVSEKKINDLEVGQSYKAELDAIQDKLFEGVISSISGAMDDSSKGYLVNISINNPDHLIKDGMFVRVYL